MENRKIQKYFFYIALIIMAASIAVPSIRLISSKAPKAINGILDLSDWDPVKDGAIKLDGEWEFYYNQLLNPKDFMHNQNVNKSIQYVPSIWSSYKVGKSKLPAQGLATYRLKILLPNNNESFGIKTLNIRASNRILVNSRQVLACGSPGNSLKNTVHKNYADTAYFNVDTNEIEIIVQVANYKYYNSGIIQSIYFGNQKSITALRIYYVFIDAALISGMLFLSLYFFGLNFQRRSSRELFFYGAYCLSQAIYLCTHSEKLINFAFPGIPYDIFTKIQAISIVLKCYFLFRFVFYSFKGFYSDKALNVTNYLAAVFILIISFINLHNSPYNGAIFLFLIIYMVITISLVVFKQIRKDIQGRFYLYIVIISSIILTLIDILNLTTNLEPNFFPPVFQPIFALSIAFFMSEKYENAFKTAEHLSERLSSLDKLKDDFLAKTSHELKTPLNGIINISQSMLEGAGGRLNSSQSEDVQLIMSIGKRLSTLVYDILDYSKLKSMDITLKLTCIDVHQVVESTVDIFRYVIKGKPLKIENQILPDTFFVIADENRLKQIISNLLDNAVKFTSLGSIVISCNEKEEFAFIAIKDTGVGIPSSKLKDIFNSYEQLESNTSVDATGTGLGLPITKQLVELHEGQIFAESEPGKGSCFTFSLPCGERKKTSGILSPENKKKVMQEAAFEENNMHYSINTDGEFSILVVDDEYSNLKALLNTLSVWKYNVTAVGSAESALHLLEGALKYDLCILDVMMPIMSGYEACRRIREKFSPLDLPVLMLTAKSLSEDIETGFMAGANDFLQKPFDAGELKCRVNTLVHLKKSKDLLLEKETAFLQAQIKPHFIFNALNTINSFCYTDPFKAGELLAELGVFLRSSFDFRSTSSYITVEKELRLVKAYVAIEKARFGKKLEVEYNIDPSALKYGILPLTIQPIVENSIRHGLMKRDQGGKITLNLVVQEELIHIQVIDNGIGIPEDILDVLVNLKPESSGVGLTNINRRLLNYYGTVLTISSEKGNGTTVSFSIPVKYYTSTTDVISY